MERGEDSHNAHQYVYSGRDASRRLTTGSEWRTPGCVSANGATGIVAVRSITLPKPEKDFILKIAVRFPSNLLYILKEDCKRNGQVLPSLLVRGWHKNYD